MQRDCERWLALWSLGWSRREEAPLPRHSHCTRAVALAAPAAVTKTVRRVPIKHLSGPKRFFAKRPRAWGCLTTNGKVGTSRKKR